ncbi:TAR DNA-binding protein-43 homolog isoform X2 [Brevipalpus obovatus]|uniref:TAR DNA-binding protein-43 homolog isoform X2 n=1 Tax=Brevipalpus obovatus TaxID=246614 RepID=UPI003D9DD94B
MSSFIAVCEDESSDPIELPVEEDGCMLLTTLTSQFPGASGLKYKNEDTGAWRAVSLSEHKFQTPDRGWNSSTRYYAVFPKENKRKNEESSDDEASAKSAKKSKCSDLIVLGLPWKTTEAELRDYFSQYGELLMAQVKKDIESGLSKGFGFIRFADFDVQKKVIGKRHNIGGRWCDVRIPLSRGDPFSSEFNRKIFVGRLSEDITTEDLREYFSKYGEITDVFIPRPFRAFAFVTFESETAQNLCGEDHIVKGVSLHVSNAMPKSEMGMGMGRFRGGGPMEQDSSMSNYHFNSTSLPPMKALHGGGGLGGGGGGGGPTMNHHQGRNHYSPYFSSYAARRSTYGQQSMPRRTFD